jgi:hypothetical protein
MQIRTYASSSFVVAGRSRATSERGKKKVANHRRLGGSLRLPARHTSRGPGAGITVIGAVLGLVSAIAVAVAGLVWHPVKRLRAKRRDRTTTVLTHSRDSA